VEAACDETKRIQFTLTADGYYPHMEEMKNNIKHENETGNYANFTASFETRFK